MNAVASKIFIGSIFLIMIIMFVVEFCIIFPDDYHEVNRAIYQGRQ